MNQKTPFVTPRSFMSGQLAEDAVAQELAWPLAAGSGSLAFSIIEIFRPELPSLRPSLLDRTTYENNPNEIDEEIRPHVDGVISTLTNPISPFAGLNLSRPLLMGIVNVTPDSFSDGGKFFGTDDALDHARSLRNSGADILDIGGESTRPGASPVDPDEEISRVIPVVQNLASEGACVSIDTRHAKVMKAAIEVGAGIVNDVTALRGDPDSIKVIADAGVPAILMHMQGEPQTMQDDPSYDWAPGDVLNFLRDRIHTCVDSGIRKENIAIDPGIGFGKTVSHNGQIMNHLSMFLGLGRPLVFGASRKSFIGMMSQGETADKRLPGSIAAAARAAGRGAHILRVHDVAETRQALDVIKHLS